MLATFGAVIWWMQTSPSHDVTVQTVDSSAIAAPNALIDSSSLGSDQAISKGKPLGLLEKQTGLVSFGNSALALPVAPLNAVNAEANGEVPMPPLALPQAPEFAQVPPLPPSFAMPMAGDASMPSLPPPLPNGGGFAPSGGLALPTPLAQENTVARNEPIPPLPTFANVPAAVPSVQAIRTNAVAVKFGSAVVEPPAPVANQEVVAPIRTPEIVKMRPMTIGTTRPSTANVPMAPESNTESQSPAVLSPMAVTLNAPTNAKLSDELSDVVPQEVAESRSLKDEDIALNAVPSATLPQSFVSHAIETEVAPMEGPLVVAPPLLDVVASNQPKADTFTIPQPIENPPATNVVPSNPLPAPRTAPESTGRIPARMVSTQLPAKEAKSGMVDDQELQKQLQRLVPNGRIELSRSVKGAIIVRGTVPDDDTAREVMSLVRQKHLVPVQDRLVIQDR